MSEWALKRFWKAVAVAEDEDGFLVHLDGRKVMTPAKTPLHLPTRALADRIAQEWDAQEAEVKPAQMPFTQMANSAIDKVTPQRVAVADMLAEYGGTDLLCYRAEGPDSLTQRQAALWDSLLDWAAETYGARLQVIAGVMPVAQEADALARLGAEVHKLDSFTLAGFHDLVSISGSLIIGLATLAGVQPAEDLWLASRVDEMWQEEQWGADEEATEHAALRRVSFLNAAEFCRICVPGMA